MGAIVLAGMCGLATLICAVALFLVLTPWQRLLFLSLLVIAACAGLSGCSTFPHASTAEAEGVWQTMAAIDTLQTVTIARNDRCLFEQDRAAAFLYGTRYPSPARVIAINAPLALLHFYIGGWLDRQDGRGWVVVKYVFYGVTLGYSGGAIVHNTDKGIGFDKKYRGC